jgi:hypothetical protein
VIFPLIRQWVPRPQLLDESWEKAFSKQRRVLTFANGSTIQFLTFEQDLDAHAGAALHRVHFDEEPEGEKAPCSSTTRRCSAWSTTTATSASR